MTEKHHSHGHHNDAHGHNHKHGCCKGHSQESCHSDQGAPAVGPQQQQQQAPTVSASELELEQLRRDVAEYKDKYLRTLAEGENGRKRLQKEKQEMIQYATQSLIAEFLTPIDHMENALKYTQQMSDDVKHWAVGFQMILTQFKDVLSINGVVPFTSEGRPFDPHRHEAIETVATADFAPGTVIEETVRGYLMGDKVVRPARVKVAKAVEETNKEQTL